MESSEVAAVGDLIDLDEPTDLPNIFPERKRKHSIARKINAVNLAEDTLQILDLNILDLSLDTAMLPFSSTMSSSHSKDSNNDKSNAGASKGELSSLHTADFSSINELDMAFVNSGFDESCSCSEKEPVSNAATVNATVGHNKGQEGDDCSNSSFSSVDSQERKENPFVDAQDDMGCLFEPSPITNDANERVDLGSDDVDADEEDNGDDQENAEGLGERSKESQNSDRMLNDDVFIPEDDREVKLLDITNFTFPSPAPITGTRNKSFGNLSINLMDMSLSKLATNKSFTKEKFSTPKPCLKPNFSVDTVTSHSRRASKSVSFQSPGICFGGKRLSNIRKTPIRRSISRFSSKGVSRTPDSVGERCAKFSTPNRVVSTSPKSPFTAMVEKFAHLALVTPPSSKMNESRPITDVSSIIPASFEITCEEKLGPNSINSPDNNNKTNEQCLRL